ncbi:unnamed protein product [Triticum turgidum subsp. durum]|uniref:Uncharacterized protein n=1 Tax=Triticum turgidum subsp. durum TaxID=4567 RepID=A0A9R0V206_TRITD|nr:unnamed protein product [Triticum turgidum subsp. durum]
MVAVQGAINVGVTIGSILLAGNSLQIMYTSLVPDGPLKLYHFIIAVDFILPVVMYNMVVSPPRRSVVYVANVAIMVLFTGLGVIGAVASVRKLVLNAGRFKLFNDHVVK